MSNYYRSLIQYAGGTNFLTNLVAYYSFDGSNANDIHTGTHNGTVIGSPTFPSGKNGNCIDFGNDNNLNYVNIADNNDFSFTNGTTDVPATISMWMNYQGVGSVGSWYINKRGATSGSDEWQFIFYLNRLQFYKFQHNNNSIYQLTESSSSPFIANAWYHISVTIDGTSSIGSTKIYINGNINVALDANYGGTYTRMNNGNAITRLGSNSWSLDPGFKHKGKLDEIAIWKNRALSALEITELYNAGAGKFYNTF